MTGRRFEPLPAAVAARSRLAGRVVLEVGGSTSRAGSGGRRSEVARVSSTGIFELGLPQLIGNHALSRAGGLGCLAGYDDFLAAVRALSDDLLDPGRPGWVIEQVPSGEPAEVARAVLPDAVVVDGRDPLAVAAVVDTPAPAGGPGPDDPPDLTDRLILVVGSPRSGTTWLEQLLLAHPQTGGVEEAETWLFRGTSHLWANHRGAGDLAAVADADRLAAAIRGFSARLLGGALARQPGARWFVEKTPGHVHHLREINASWPDAWVVHLLRDGRDVARSGAEMVHGPDDIGECAVAWAAAVAAARRDGPELSRFREIRYEDVVADPVGVAADLLTWAGLDVDDEARARIAAAGQRRVSQYNTTGPVGVGKWHTLAPAELRIVLAAAGDALVATGYVDPSEVEAARRALRRPAGRWAELRRRGRPRRGAG